MTKRQRHRRWCMLHAHMIYHSILYPQVARENVCWYLLLVWASLGGTADEVIRG